MPPSSTRPGTPACPPTPVGSGTGPGTYARDLRLQLACEHLGAADDIGLVEPDEAFDRFASSAAALQAWYDGGRTGPPPPGRLRPLAPAPIGPVQRLWATSVYRRAYDPDGRPRHLRAGAF